MTRDAIGPTVDVRMHGFGQRAEVGTVLAWIDRHAAPLGAETVPLDDAVGRVLAADAIAPLDVPAFDRAAMDGYALRGAATAGASEYNPLGLPVLGQALPGRPFGGEVRPDAAVRIMTGAPMPAGLDAVLPAEYASEKSGEVEVAQPVAPGQHVGRRGEDVRAGSTVLTRGRRLRPQDLGVLASLGCAEVDVVRCPAVRIVATGNEVIAPGTPKGAHQVYDANSPMLRALVARDGGRVERHARLGDDPDRIRAALVDPGADVILVSGGSSVGWRSTASLCALRARRASAGSAQRSSSCCPATRCPAFARTTSSPAARSGSAAAGRPAGRTRYVKAWSRARSSPRSAASTTAGSASSRAGSSRSQPAARPSCPRPRARTAS
jgi:molybdopterin molybdotransferase